MIGDRTARARSNISPMSSSVNLPSRLDLAQDVVNTVDDFLLDLSGFTKLDRDLDVQGMPR